MCTAQQTVLPAPGISSTTPTPHTSVQAETIGLCPARLTAGRQRCLGLPFQLCSLQERWLRSEPTAGQGIVGAKRKPWRSGAQFRDFAVPDVAVGMSI